MAVLRRTSGEERKYFSLKIWRNENETVRISRACDPRERIDREDSTERTDGSFPAGAGHPDAEENCAAEIRSCDMAKGETGREGRAAAGSRHENHPKKPKKSQGKAFFPWLNLHFEAFHDVRIVDAAPILIKFINYLFRSKKSFSRRNSIGRVLRLAYRMVFQVPPFSSPFHTANTRSDLSTIYILRFCSQPGK